MKTDINSTNQIIFGDQPLSIENIVDIAHKKVSVSLNKDKAYREKIQQGYNFLEALLKQEGVIYGVTTGYGDSCTTDIPMEQVEELPLRLIYFHRCGLGNYFSPSLARAILAARLASLVQGFSGVRWILLEQFVNLLNADIMPLIPEEGSVGASGDLTPLAYVAALLIGESEALHQGKTYRTKDIFDEFNITPLKLKPKEGLAIMNGTAVMTAIACEAFIRAEYLSRLSARLTALSSIAIEGNREHFASKLFEIKPHPGQAQIASWISEDLSRKNKIKDKTRLQDRYSIRCAPHIIGVLRDSLPWMRQLIEIELNSANDNPLIDIEEEQVLHGGNFYGGHIAFVMDSLKICVANLADLMDRQLALLVDRKFNNGLPANLSGASVKRLAINHGFKAVQIGTSAWTAEALKLTMPASVFSRSTESHNQDKVSMGTIAARDALRVIALTEQVASAHTLATYQACLLRKKINGNELSWGEDIAQFLDTIAQDFSFVVEDRSLDSDLRKFIQIIQNRQWNLY